MGMKALLRGIFMLLLSTAAVAAYGQSVTPEDEYKKLIKISEDVNPLGENAFGERISLYSGALSFEQKDISLRGNGPELALIRTFKNPEVSNYIDGYRLGRNLLVDWDMEVPRIETLVSDKPDGFGMPAGWNFLKNGGRCTSFGGAPSYTFPRHNAEPIEWYASDWWKGYKLYIPGEGEQDLLKIVNENNHIPSMNGSDGAPIKFTAVTKQNWSIGCLASTANGQPGEGFLVVSPQGIKYWMNWLIYKPEVSLLAFARDMGVMLATRVEDRYGNYLAYSYGDQGRLLSIVASDGRRIDFNYESWRDGNAVRLTDARLTDASGNARIWKYTYDTSQNPSRLSSVQLPDGSAWKFDMAAIMPANSVHYYISCTSYDNPPNLGASGTATITHPSGLVGKFTVRVMLRGQSYTPSHCRRNLDNTWTQDVQAVYSSTSIISKTYSGAGLSDKTWNFSYSPPNGSYADQCGNGCPSTVWTNVQYPDAHVESYTFSNLFDATQSLLLRRDYYATTSSPSALRSEVTAYAQSTSGPWPTRFGDAMLAYSNRAQYETLSPSSQVNISQDGDTYTWQAEAFNEYAQPTKVKRFNSISWQPSIEEQTDYLNDTPHWVLGLPTKVTNLSRGEEVDRYDYDLSRVTLSARWHFGQQVMSYGYDAQGNLASFTDGSGHATTLLDYKRGIPQTIHYPDGTTEKLAVDDFGQIGSITDQAGSTTNYGYDLVGRLTRVDYPAGDTVAWLPKTYTYEFVGDERGLSGGHWRRTMAKGEARTITYYDAMLRPVLSDTFINGNGGSHGNVRTDYDWRGQTTFASYTAGGTPNLGDIGAGIHSSYDALGRLVQTQEDSELGPLTTATVYSFGTRKLVTDPRGNTTTFAYRAFDEPSYDQPIQVQAPEGITQDIARDLYGNPTSITQSGSYQGANVGSTKYFAYDNYHRLCRYYDPESNSTVMDYDAANNVAWKAAGMGINGDGTVCGREQVPDTAKTSYSYDAMNRAKTEVPPSGTQSTIYTYDALGNLQSTISGITIWGSSRNKLGLLTGEGIWVDGLGNKGLAYEYNAYGNLNKVTYPDGGAFGYFPDALGRPTVLQGGSTFFAHDIGYFPDGGTQAYTLGNGVYAQWQRNARQLPSNLSYTLGGASRFNENYHYDSNGNLLSIDDLVDGKNNQTLGYDNLNRLTSANAPSSWGQETYQYDPLNNIRAKLAAGYNFTFNYNALNRLDHLSVGAPGNVFSAYTYDARGNRASDRVLATNRSYAFDAKNQLLGVSGIASYAYDAQGRRAKKALASDNGKSSYSFYDHAGRLMYAYDEVTGKQTDYLYLGDKLLARWSSGVTTYLLTDRLGTPVKEMDAAGNVLNASHYRPHGELFDGPNEQEPGFTGHVNDPETAFTYMQARYYESSVGQFLSVDPVLPEAGNISSFNRYGYANNNPVANFDPDGRSCVSAQGILSCTPTDSDGHLLMELPSFSVPSPNGFPGFIDNGREFYHVYDYRTPIKGISEEVVRENIIDSPTPAAGRNPATPAGTQINAQPTSGGRRALAEIAKVMNLGDSSVTSYLISDSQGRPWALNVTNESHTLAYGYVLRGVQNGEVISYGEGVAAKQSLGKLSNFLINDVWLKKNMENISTDGPNRSR